MYKYGKKLQQLVELLFNETALSSVALKDLYFRV